MVKLKEIFGIDLRALALFRICLGLLIIGDLIVRMSDLRMFYTDDGVFPCSMLSGYPQSFTALSIHILNGSIFFQAALFFISGIFAILLIIGFRTRLVTFISWFLLISLHIRNPIILDAQDNLLKMLLFWGMFLPLGAYYSIDSALNSSNEKLPKQFFSMATIGLLTQIIIVYVFSAILKSENKEWANGTGLYYSLNLISYSTEFARIFSNTTPMFILVFLNNFVFCLEMYGSLLLLFPIYNGSIRTIVTFAFIGMHIGIGLCLSIGLFPYVSITGMLPFLPGSFWDKTFSYLRTKERLGLKIYYDLDCGFCKKLVLIIKTFFLIPETIILPAQENPSINELMKKENSWVVIDHIGNHHFKFKAMLAVLRASPVLFPLVPVLSLEPVSKLGKVLYETVASNRKTASKFTSLFTYKPLNIEPSNLNNILAAFFTAYIFFWNVSTVNLKFKFPSDLIWITSLFHIDQRWGMFIPGTIWYSGYIVIPGKLNNGKEIDLFREGKPVSWAMPDIPSKLFKTRYQTRYLVNITSDQFYQAHLPYYAGYLCRSWNETHKGDKQLESLEVYIISEETLPGNKTPEAKKNFIWKQSCL